MKRRKKIAAVMTSVLAAVSVFSSSVTPTMADSVVDFTRKGSVTITYTDTAEGTGSTKDPIPGATFVLYKIGQMDDEVSVVLGTEGMYDYLDEEQTTDEGTSVDVSIDETTEGEPIPENQMDIPISNPNEISSDSVVADSQLPDSGEVEKPATEAGSSEEDAFLPSTGEEEAAPTETDASQQNAQQTAEAGQSEPAGVTAPAPTPITSGIVSVVDGVVINESLKADEALVKKVQAAYANENVPAGGAVYTGITGDDGRAVIENMELGVYLGVETQPAKEHFASKPFIVVLPQTSDDGTYWEYDRPVNPKPIAGGDLVLKKTLAGDNTEAQKEFHFVITFDSAKAVTNVDSYHFTKSDKSEGHMKSGDTIALKGGENVTIDTIPVGTQYSIKETEADQDGYKTTSTGETGTIQRTQQAKAEFVNERNVVPTNPPVQGTPGTSPIQTSDSVVPIVLASAGAILAIGILAFVMYKKKGAKKS